MNKQLMSDIHTSKNGSDKCQPNLKKSKDYKKSALAIRFEKTGVKNFHGDVSSMKLFDMLPDMLIAIGKACGWSSFTSKYHHAGGHHVVFCNYNVGCFEQDKVLFISISDLKKYKPSKSSEKRRFKARENILKMLLDITSYMVLCPRIKEISRISDNSIKIAYNEPVKVVEEKMLMKSPLENDRIVKSAINDNIKNYDDEIIKLKNAIKSEEEKLVAYNKRHQQVIGELHNELTSYEQKIDVLCKAKEVLGLTR